MKVFIRNLISFFNQSVIDSLHILPILLAFDEDLNVSSNFL